MKKYLILILLAFVWNISNANKWDLLKSGRSWNILQVTYSPDMVHHDSATYFVKFDADTIINTHKYCHVFQATNAEFYNKTLNGYVREDSLVGLYFRDLQGKEGLLYKYNLKVGDSVLITNKRYAGLDSVRYIVSGVDSVQLDGKYKKKYTMAEKHYEYMPEIWIEGIGSSLGILNCGFVAAGAATRLLCSYDNNVLIYKNPNYQNCYYSTSTAIHSVKDSESGINVYSGTRLNEIFIKSQVDNNIKIFNSCGQFVETVHILANQEYNINVSKYSKGIYIISPSINLSGSKKFIIY
jgi:hypothetical protein